MSTEETNKKNGATKQNGCGEKKQPGLLKDEDYKKLGHFEFSMFLKEDCAMYRSILESEPYDWELMKFFHEQKIMATRIKKQDARHLSRTRVEDIMDIHPDKSVTDDELYDRDFLENLRYEMKGTVSDVAFNRAIKYCVYGYSKSEIARMEGKCFSSVYESIEQTKKEMKEVLINRIIKEQMIDQGGKESDTFPEDC